MIGHQTVRQELDVIKVTVFKDAHDHTRTVCHRRRIEECLGFSLGRQFDERTGPPCQFFLFFQEPYHRFRCFITSNAQVACYTCRRLIGRTVVPQRAPATDKLHAGHAFGTLPTTYYNQTHFTRVLRMGPAAWRPIKISNLNDADTLGAKTFLAERQLRCCRWGHGMEANHTIIEDHRIGQFFCPLYSRGEFIGRPVECQVNLSNLLEDTETSRLSAAELPEGL